MTVTAPTVLVDSAYSRNFEREADDFAFHWMAQHNVAPAELGNLLARLAQTYGDSQSGYLASHPSIRERVNAADANTFTRDKRQSRQLFDQTRAR